ncbi:MAG: hypothetical protein EHM85_02305 [Desulfobacteraceae bacterium]|nr:MAG: hypothetical protein EHM85_02305 [Desulfobacteraceae bacterium]
MKERCFVINLIIVSMLFFAGCASTGGDVIRITNVEEEKNPISGLKASDLAILEEIKKSSVKKDGTDNVISNVINKTRNFSVAEYIKLHPDADGRGTREYVVGGDDVLSITIYEEKDLSRDAVRVSADGYISFPLITRLKVEGLTISEIGVLISTKLAEGQYLLDAHVSVMVTEYKSKQFLVLGAVKKPGSYPLSANERVLNAISKAEGIEQTGAGKKAKIIRTENPNTGSQEKIVINVDLQGVLQGTDQYSNIFLSDKDILFIPTAENFYIIGQVKNPGSYPLIDREISLVESIGIAGGFTNIAARNRTRIVRVENGVEKVIEVKVDAITEAGKKIHDVIIQPNDIIIVPESFF